MTNYMNGDMIVKKKITGQPVGDLENLCARYRFPVWRGERESIVGARVKWGRL